MSWRLALAPSSFANLAAIARTPPGTASRRHGVAGRGSTVDPGEIRWNPMGTDICHSRGENDRIHVTRNYMYIYIYTYVPKWKHIYIYICVYIYIQLYNFYFIIIFDGFHECLWHLNLLAKSWKKDRNNKARIEMNCLLHSADFSGIFFFAALAISSPCRG